MISYYIKGILKKKMIFITCIMFIFIQNNVGLLRVFQNLAEILWEQSNLINSSFIEC